MTNHIAGRIGHCGRFVRPGMVRRPIGCNVPGNTFSVYHANGSPKGNGTAQDKPVLAESLPNSLQPPAKSLRSSRLGIMQNSIPDGAGRNQKVQLDVVKSHFSNPGEEPFEMCQYFWVCTV